MGFAGGIWLVWDESLADIEILSSSLQVVHGVVSRKDKDPFCLSIVYASPI